MQRAVILAGLVLCALGGTWFLHKSPGNQIAGALAAHGDRSANRVVLTFDDGPSPKNTGALLDQLDQLNVRATFFLNGSAMEKHPAPPSPGTSTAMPTPALKVQTTLLTRC